jgi:hypothetical protein
MTVRELLSPLSFKVINALLPMFNGPDLSNTLTGLVQNFISGSLPLVVS